MRPIRPLILFLCYILFTNPVQGDSSALETWVGVTLILVVSLPNYALADPSLSDTPVQLGKVVEHPIQSQPTQGRNSIGKKIITKKLHIKKLKQKNQI